MPVATETVTYVPVESIFHYGAVGVGQESNMFTPNPSMSLSTEYDNFSSFTHSGRSRGSRTSANSTAETIEHTHNGRDSFTRQRLRTSSSASLQAQTYGVTSSVRHVPDDLLFTYGKIGNGTSTKDMNPSSQESDPLPSIPTKRDSNQALPLPTVPK